MFLFFNVACFTSAIAADADSKKEAMLPINIHQLASYQASIETTIDLHLKWFAFASTINATVIGLILTHRLPLRTRIIPVLFILGEMLRVLLQASS